MNLIYMQKRISNLTETGTKANTGGVDTRAVTNTKGNIVDIPKVNIHARFKDIYK